MSLELVKFNTVQGGLREIGNLAYSMMQNLTARVETPVLEDGTDLWKNTWLDSKDINFCGCTNDDNRHRFKIDRGFDNIREGNTSFLKNGLKIFHYLVNLFFDCSFKELTF